MRRLLCALALLPPLALAAPDWLQGGHVKARWQTLTYPEDSAFREPVGAVAHDQAGSLRLKLRTRTGPLAWEADYQLLARRGDAVELANSGQAGWLLPPPLPDDERRWWDLSHEISSDDDSLWVQRLDRLAASWSGDKTVLRLGRQAVSWGNGLIYNPMDFFNPFDPAAIDTEYKVGDDMLYGQYLLDSGSDWQLVRVQRRDARGDVTSEVSSTALKYHGFGLEQEYDLLLAEHFDQLQLGVGGVLNTGDAVLRGDLLLTDASDGWVASAVINWSYSWVWGGRNVSAVAEYFFNGFGLREADYSAENLAAATDLLQRLERGELFTLGRHYLAGSLLVEVNPLLNVTPTLFYNLGDNSALAQLVLQWDLAQDWQLLGALNLPLGPAGTEFGGLEITGDELNLGSGPGLFAQLAYYF
ncbi:hypothetical protein F0M18_16320 [Pseudohalioglobus sediminis]|uniref:Uncharacterized protein n=1 Tax=Pseudohalioglobus sediminis TaxID=2606449 RepID=A0A5B0WS10_9GAMM|nr:hypothetical protein [Pseudohalioglobus sediminis]KAA1189237.1 hypothetical protein F0M18_16320 [Pseudohalioglobus sediminis]